MTDALFWSVVVMCVIAALFSLAVVSAMVVVWYKRRLAYQRRQAILTETFTRMIDPRSSKNERP